MFWCPRPLADPCVRVPLAMPPNLGDRSFFLLIVGRLPSQITVSRYHISKISKISFLKDWAICQGIKPNTTLVCQIYGQKKIYIFHIYQALVRIDHQLKGEVILLLCFIHFQLRMRINQQTRKTHQELYM